MSELRPFKFWCQKVLPLVYDDSLSYYELLCKVVEYLNNTISDVNKLSDEFQTLYNYVHDYFKNLDVQEEINNKLDELVNSGRLDILLNNYIPYVTPQMFGGKGDGVTDDTVAFQKCFDSNKKIIVPNGNYVVGECEQVNKCEIELDILAYITIRGDYFIHSTNNLSIKGGRIYGETKAPESRYYSKKAITGKLSMINITDTQFYQCIALYQTEGNYCGFINCYNMWVYDSIFIVANKSLNYVTCVGCALQNANNMIEATNYENISLIGCNIENVTNLFSPTYVNAPYKGVNINNCYIEYTKMFYNGVCKNISIENSWIYTDVTLVELTRGPGSCVIRNNNITIISDILLTNTSNCTVIIEFNVGAIVKQNIIIDNTNINSICDKCIYKIGNQDEYFTNPSCNYVKFNGTLSDIPHSLSSDSEDNRLYYNTGVIGLKSKTFVCICLSLGKNDMLIIHPPKFTFCIEQASHILYYFDGSAWRNSSTGAILE